MLKSSQVNPISWSQGLTAGISALFRSVVKRPQTKAYIQTLSESKPSPLTVTASTIPSHPTLVCLTLVGVLNRHSYNLVIESALAHYRQGGRLLLLDLGQTTAIELSGLFALLNLARLYSGQSLLDPEDGWAALRMPLDPATHTWSESVKIITPSPQAAAALERASFCRFFERYADVKSAIAAF